MYGYIVVHWSFLKGFDFKLWECIRCLIFQPCMMDDIRICTQREIVSIVGFFLSNQWGLVSRIMQSNEVLRAGCEPIFLSVGRQEQECKYHSDAFLLGHTVVTSKLCDRSSPISNLSWRYVWLFLKEENTNFSVKFISINDITASAQGSARIEGNIKRSRTISSAILPS